MRKALILVPLLLLACKTKTEGTAPSTSTSSAPAAPTTAASVAATASATLPPKKSLDATACNPGTSIEPMAKGKTVETDELRYTLLDARIDEITNPLEKGKKVLLVKLQVENISQRDDLNLSIADVAVTRDKAAPVMSESKLMLGSDFFYDRTKSCVDLAADVAKGTFPRGAKVVGYFIRTLGEEPYKSLFVSFKYVSPESATTAKAFKAAGTLQLK